MNIETFIQTLSAMYMAKDNDARHEATLALLKTEELMSSEEMLRIGVGLLRVSDQRAAVQAYGAVLLRRAIVSNRLRANNIPYSDIITWYLAEPSLGRLLCSDLVNLITECMVHEWPERYPDLMKQLCLPQAQLSRHPRKIRLLCAIVEKIMDPHFGNVPVPRMKILRNALSSCTREILIEVIQALFDLYTASGGEGSLQFADHAGESIVDCLTVIMNVATFLPVSQWWELGLGNALFVLIRWKPAAQEALAATTSLLRSDRLSQTAVGPELLALVAAVLGSAEIHLMERNYNILEELVEVLLELPGSILQAIVAPVSQCCLVLLCIPSIYLATSVCQVLKRLGDVAFAHINPLDLMIRFSALIQKKKFHPISGTYEEGKQLSEQQYGSAEPFERGFAEFRGLVGNLLASVAAMYPVVSNQFVLQIFSNLPDGRGTPSDPRTPYGFVTQQSNTFCEWEATQFLLHHLSESFKYSSEHLPEAITALVEKQTDDMVLCPVYLNMLSSFWVCRDSTALGVWQGTLGIIFSYVDRKSKVPGDIDTMSARKRALTLLVNVCSQHANELSSFSDSFMKRLEQLLMRDSTLPHERTLLYESMAALTNSLPPDAAQYRLQSFFTPIVKILIQQVSSMDQKKFNNVLVAQTPDLQIERDMLRDSAVVIAGVMRRCKNCPYLIEISTELTPSIVRLMDLIHNIRVGQLPPEYASILEMDRDLREQYLPGQSRRSVPRKNGPEKSRVLLLDIRMSLYQVIGAMSTFLPAEALRSMLNTLVPSAELLPTHAMRSLIVHCMFPIGISHPQLIGNILPTCGIFFSRVMQRRSARLEDDIIDMKQLFFFSKDIFVFIRQHIIEKNLLNGNVLLTRLVVEVALSILESGSNVLDAFRFIITTTDSGKKASAGNTAVEAELDEISVIAFGRALDFSIRADDALLSVKDREKLMFIVSENYVSHYPKYTMVLQSRFAQAQIDELHTQLVMLHRFDSKRQRFKEFLLAAKSTKVK